MRSETVFERCWATFTSLDLHEHMLHSDVLNLYSYEVFCTDTSSQHLNKIALYRLLEYVTVFEEMFHPHEDTLRIISSLL